MAATLSPQRTPTTVAELLERLGVGAERVLMKPLPGTSTEKGVLAVAAREDRQCELVDGVLVEKAMGSRESMLAVALALTCVPL